MKAVLFVKSMLFKSMLVKSMLFMRTCEGNVV